jgi:hypothetical protein
MQHPGLVSAVLIGPIVGQCAKAAKVIPIGKELLAFHDAKDIK